MFCDTILQINDKTVLIRYKIELNCEIMDMYRKLWLQIRLEGKRRSHGQTKQRIYDLINSIIAKDGCAKI